MKYLAVLFILAAASTAFAYSYDIFTTKNTCESNNGFWCYRCQGTGENAFRADTCVQSNLNCDYSCSTVCGASCTQNSDCTANLTDRDTCQYAGACSSCSCNYQEQYCPQNGTINNGICYYGNRQCGYTGCSISKCTLQQGQICDPSNGCIQGTGQPQDSYYEDYKCSGNDVFADHVYYSCNATACSYSKIENALIERCQNGCIDGRCDDGTCNLNGLVFDCNRLDAYYGSQYCIGNDIYRNYRNYSCGASECQFVETGIKQMKCALGCSDGACVSAVEPPGPTNNVNPETPIPSVADNQTPGKVILTGKKVYNGWLFGKGDYAVFTPAGASGIINFTVIDSNGLGILSVVSGSNTLYYGKPVKETLSIPFVNSPGSIRFTTTSSGWFIFAPASYDIRYVIVDYE